MDDRAFCVHGHFYQPPREDPITGEIPLEPGAAPFRNWNERIHNQCYRPNADLGNFERISFNIGPTLLHWMEEFDKGTLSKIVSQNQKNVGRYGVGNAMAQAFNHSILPLATRVDKVTQVLWGIYDFQHYFGYRPKGMWLPETAVDMESLEVMADCGIEYTILAPWQAEDTIDPMYPYLINLSGGKRISVFFYEENLSARISFDPSISVNADTFYQSILLPCFLDVEKANEKGRVLTIASDGELYGHHQPFRDKFLERLTDNSVHGKEIKFTYPGLWLAQHPAVQTTKIRENTSWSCHHGVVRWSGECACTPHPEWKMPLRLALNYLAREIDKQYILTLSPYFKDPWLLRHEFIRVINREIDFKELVYGMMGTRMDEDDLYKVELLLLAQYEAQRMFSSCGWFFDDFDRIEPRNNVAYAAQAVYLTYLATGVNLKEPVTKLLSKVVSWRSGLRGDLVFKHHIERASSTQFNPIWVSS